MGALGSPPVVTIARHLKPFLQLNELLQYDYKAHIKQFIYTTETAHGIFQYRLSFPILFYGLYNDAFNYQKRIWSNIGLLVNNELEGMAWLKLKSYPGIFLE
jgi:hypothetical protein